MYKNQLQRFSKTPSLNIEKDTVNLQDEYPNVMVGNHVEKRDDNIPPFYVMLIVHDKLLHNCMLDSRASHNLMPKTVMEELGLEITIAYHDLYSFDSRAVQCLCVIKDLAMTLTQFPMKSVVMDVVVADIPVKYGMLLSRSWVGKLRGTLQMDMTYTTIPIFDGEKKRLYKENKLKYIVSNARKSKNVPVYVIEENMDCFQLAVSVEFQEEAHKEEIDISAPPQPN